MRLLVPGTHWQTHYDTGRQNPAWVVSFLFFLPIREINSVTSASDIRGPCTPDPHSSSLAPPVLVEGMNNTKNFVSVAHISMDWELASVDDSVSPVMHNTRPRELVNRLFAPIDLTDAPSASRYSAGYHNQQGQKTGSRLYPGDPALFPYPPAPLVSRSKPFVTRAA